MVAGGYTYMCGYVYIGRGCVIGVYVGVGSFDCVMKWQQLLLLML